MDIYRLPECPIVGRELEVVTEIYQDENSNLNPSSISSAKSIFFILQFVIKAKDSTRSLRKSRRTRKKRKSKEITDDDSAEDENTAPNTPNDKDDSEFDK
ncbi:hypothetical protein HZS_3334 [Henneguya salminicola]|nr:hypothetical protein HZS_3334 [Henneguya salminicola]